LIAEKIEFKKGPMLIARYLGANHEFDGFDLKDPDKTRALRIQMDRNTESAVKKFQGEYGNKLHTMTSPFITDKE
jgi:hypothetical protein